MMVMTPLKHKEELRLGVRGRRQTGGRRPLAGGPTREIPIVIAGLRTWREKYSHVRKGLGILGAHNSNHLVRKNSDEL